MVRYRAIGPISIGLGGGNLPHNNIIIATYDQEQFNEMLTEQNRDYWSKAEMDFYRKSSWIKMDFEVNTNEKAWEKAVRLITQMLQAFGLFKSTLSLLSIGGLRVLKLDEESSGPRGYFGWEHTILDKQYYFLRMEEYLSFIDFLSLTL